jgi:hypothetical protein
MAFQRRRWGVVDEALGIRDYRPLHRASSRRDLVDEYRYSVFPGLSPPGWRGVAAVGGSGNGGQLSSEVYL